MFDKGTVRLGPPRVYQLRWDNSDNIHYTPTHYEEIEMPDQKINHEARTARDLATRIAAHDIEVLKQKGATYGDSWKKRGGVDSYFMLCRKWDRIENMVEAPTEYTPSKETGIQGGPDTRYNILERGFLPTAYYQSGEGYDPIHGDPPDGTLLAEIRDLRRYLLLVDVELTQRALAHQHSLLAKDEDGNVLSEEYEAHKASVEEAVNDAYRKVATEAMGTDPHPKKVPATMWSCDAPSTDHCYPCPGCDVTCGTLHEPNCPLVARTYNPTDRHSRCDGCGASNGEYHSRDCPNRTLPPTEENKHATQDEG